MKIKILKQQILQHLKENKSLYIAYIIFTTFFLLSRIPFFLYHRVTGFNPDLGGFYLIVDQLNKGLSPYFLVRTPGYPFFLWFIFLFFKSNLAVMIIQNLLSMSAGLFFVSTVNTLFRTKFKWFTILSSIAMGAFMSSNVHLISDNTMLTESLYVSLFIFFFAFYFKGLYLNRKRDWIITSMLMALIILVRPVAMFFFGILLVTLIFFWVNRYSKTTIFSFLLPFAITLLCMGFYNKFTINTFAISTFTEHTLVSYTSTFQSPSPTYPPQMNDAIKKCRGLVSAEENEILKKSWDLSKIHRIFLKNFDSNRIKIYDAFLAHEKDGVYGLYQKWRPIWKKASLDAIFNHPKIYFKCVLANAVRYFFSSMQDIKLNFIWNYYQAIRKDEKIFTTSVRKSFDGFGNPKKRFYRIYGHAGHVSTIDENLVKSMLKEDYYPHTYDRKNIKKYRRYNEFMSKIIGFLFRNNIWIFLFMGIFILSIIRLVKEKLNHLGALSLFILGGCAILQGVFVSLSGIAILRYSYTLEYAYYLMVFFSPLLIYPDPAEAN